MKTLHSIPREKRGNLLDFDFKNLSDITLNLSSNFIGFNTSILNATTSFTSFGNTVRDYIVDLPQTSTYYNNLYRDEILRDGPVRYWRLGDNTPISNGDTITYDFTYDET